MKNNRPDIFKEDILYIEMEDGKTYLHHLVNEEVETLLFQKPFSELAFESDIDGFYSTDSMFGLAVNYIHVDRIEALRVIQDESGKEIVELDSSIKCKGNFEIEIRDTTNNIAGDEIGCVIFKPYNQTRIVLLTPIPASTLEQAQAKFFKDRPNMQKTARRPFGSYKFEKKALHAPEVR